MSIRFLLVDDHEIVRQGLRHIIAQQTEMEVIGEAKNGREALAMVSQLNPNIVIMDISMPDLNGIEATRKIKKNFPHIKIIALSMHHKKQFVIDMLKAGVSGYVLKADLTHDLLHAIEAVVAEGVYLSPQIAGIVAKDYASEALPINAESVSTALAPREREVLQLIAEGKSTKEIALHLHLSIKAIESTRLRIMKKLDIHNIADLVKYALREGLTSLDG